MHGPLLCYETGTAVVGMVKFTKADKFGVLINL